LIFKDFDKQKYLAIEIPPAELPSRLQRGNFVHGSSHPGPNLTMKISTECGDFEPSEDFCYKENMTADQRLNYTLPGTNSWGCAIESNKRYFINIKATNPDSPPPQPRDCNGNICTVPVQNTPPPVD